MVVLYANTLQGSIFNTARVNSGLIYDEWDPRAHLNITQDTLNEALSAITISAISLGTWWDMVPGHDVNVSQHIRVFSPTQSYHPLRHLPLYRYDVRSYWYMVFVA